MAQEEYFETLQGELDEIWSLASEARQNGEDPEPEVEIIMTEDMAERVQEFLAIDGLADRIRELNEQDMGREDMAFQLTDEFLNDELGDFDNPEEKIDAAIRTALAILTEAVVAAPLEGLQWVKTETDSEGREYIRLKYGGPIRSAGGTAQVVSVIIADYCRQFYDFDKFVPTEDEVERYVEEKDLYDRAVGLQYTPSDDEVRTIIDNCPIMLDAEAVTQEEVSGYRDLDRIPTNGGRGGMCLVAFEGIAQKVPKLQKYTEELGLDGWEWLTELPNASKVDDSDEEDEKESDADDGSDESEDNPLEGKPTRHGRAKVKPKSKYIDDTLTAGRPIFAHPSRPGGFRLRYGRSRNTGHAAGGISPATMVILNNYIAPGTQMKTERPGKAIAASPVDSLQGPTVKLNNGEVRRIDDEDEAEKYRERVDKILDLGEIGMPYGEFLENNAPLVPSSYVHEWWVQDAEDAGLTVSGLTPDKLNAAQAWNMGKKYDIPLHPKFTYLWHDLNLEEYEEFSRAVQNGEELDSGEFVITDEVAEQAEVLLLPHKHDREDEVIRFDSDTAMILQNCCDPTAVEGAEHIMEAVNTASDVEIRERAPVRIGSRMGRPEKAERRTFKRDLNIHSLFPVGEDVQRSVVDAAEASNTHNQSLNGRVDESANDLEAGEAEVDLSTRFCPQCQTETYRVKCQDCEARTAPYKECSNCGHGVMLSPEDMGETECPECDKTVKANKKQALDINDRLHEAFENLGERKGSFDKFKGVEGLVSQEKIPEPLEKGILRAKYDVAVYKDGTSRYDATDLPLTSFKPNEAGVSVEKLREIGYTEALDGEPLEDGDQLVELEVQDIIIPKKAGEYLIRVSKFMDDLLEKYYGLDPYYEADELEDLVGELLIGMAPHTSAGAIGRIVGFSDAWGQYAHPFFHAAKRRNCFHPDETLHYEVEHENGETEWNYGTIEELVENHLDMDNLETDDLGSEYSTPTKTIRVRSITDDGEQVLKELNKVQRTPATEHMITFETETGKDITVTPEHGMLVYEEGEQKKIPAREVGEGDKFLEPTDDGCTEFEQSGDYDIVTVVEKDIVESTNNKTYNVEVRDTNTLEISGIAEAQCDSDEDAFMLALDGLINYSEHYLNHHKSGWSMDEPIVMNKQIDPTEIDDEAHNVDIASQYPKEFYEATMHAPGPKEVDIEVAEDRLDNPVGFNHSLDTESIDGGPEITEYKTLPDMDAKIDAQFDISTKANCVDVANVAEKVIDGHFLADLKGNLRAFGTQDVRCTNCNSIYRRMPLEGECRNCGKEKLILTVFDGSVTKYLSNMKDISETHTISPYVNQIIDEYDRATESIFENDHDKQSDLSEFF